MTLSIRLICALVLVTLVAQIASEPTTLATIATIAGITGSIINIAKEGTKLIKNTVRYFGDDPTVNGPAYQKHFNADHDQLLAHLRSLSRARYEIKSDLDNAKDQILGQIFQKLPGLVELNNRLTRVFSHFDSVDNYYEKFVAYYEKPESYDRNKVIEFANSVTSDTRLGLNHLLDEIYKYLIRDYGVVPSSLRLLARLMEEFLEANRIPMSPQQLIHDIMLSVMYTEVKGFFTIRYSYEILTSYKQGNFSTHIETMEYDFGRRVNNSLSVFKQIMTEAPREISRNNPPFHIEDKTYTELKHVFQRFIINERDINENHDCSNTCSDYNRPDGVKHESCSYGNEVCSGKRCSGYLYDCQFNIDTDMSVCISRQNSSRFYEFIDYNDGLRLGNNQEKCTTPSLGASRHFKFPYWCDPCFCVCADSTKRSERHFNLDPVKTRAEENYVITGARFVKRKNMMHIQIREGQLLPNGRINASTLQWSEINENPIHYHTLQWEEGREINFDDLNVPKNHVLTGLQFIKSVSSANQIYRLQLKAYAAPLYYYEGVLNLRHETQFVNYDVFTSKRIDLNNRDIPTRTTTPTNLRSGNNEYLQFGPTGLEYDVGQSTIPFVDIQEVTTNPPMPMNSAGLFFRSREDNGGFVALKLFSYDYSQHVSADLSVDYKNFESYRSVMNKK